jgi:protein SCO1/2
VAEGSVPAPGALRCLVIAAVLAAATGAAAGAAEKPPAGGFEESRALAISQAALGRGVGDYAFINTDRRPVRLAEYRGKPLVISLIYTSCADICPTISESLGDAIEVAADALGKDRFNVITIGFDARNDSPQRMRAFARSHGLRNANWQFLSTDADTVDRFTEDLGFTYLPSPQGFDHVAQITVLDADLHVYRHVYGDVFDPPLLVEPLKDLVFDRRTNLTTWSGIVDKVRFFCTIYDPSTGRYRFNYSIFTMIAGSTLSLGTIGFVLVRAWLRQRRAGCP